MRIAVVYDCLFPWSTGGGERQYRLFAEAFAAAGHEVSYLTRTQWDGPVPALAGVEVVPMSGRTELYDPAGARRPGPALRFAVDLLLHLSRRRHRYDAVLVSALPTLNVLAARTALAGSGVALCADWLEVWRPEQWREYSGPVLGRVAAALQHLAVRMSPLVSCHSRMNAERLTALGLRSDPLVSPGLIHDEVAARPQLELREPASVVFVGRHIPDKHVEVVPAAVAWAREHVPGLRAQLLGDGPQRALVQREVHRLGLADVIDTPGFVSQEELDRAVAAARCVVHPSTREGYGLVVVEAAAAGTPTVLVAAPDNAAVELVEDGVNGAVAGGLQPEVLGGAIVRVVQAGRPLRESTFAWFRTAARERTMAASAAGILRALAAASSRSRSRPKGPATVV